jgi:glycosidase
MGSTQSLDCESIRIRSRTAEVQAVQIERQFFANLPLRQGINSLQAICWRGGKEIALSPTHIRNEQLAPRPEAQIRLRVEDGAIHLSAGASQAFDVPIEQFRWSTAASNPAPLVLRSGESLAARTEQSLTVAPPRQDGDYIVQLRIEDALRRTDRAAAMFRVRNGVAEEIDPRERPGWISSMILYGVAPYEFSPPGFAGIRDRLDEIASLGATAVWISPITLAAADDFGYAVMNHLVIDERFGGDAQFRQLVATAHRLGLRVIVDFVPNHLASSHPYVRNAESLGPRSVYYDWFDRDAHGEISHYFDWQHLANLNYDNPQVQNYMTAAFERMVRDFDVDGFRVDAAWAVSRRAPEFWNRLRGALQRIKPDVFLLAEASARDPHYFINGFDAAYDWTYRLGEWAWKDLFRTDGSIDLDALRADLQATARDDRHLVLHFLNNNDTAERFATEHGLPAARLAATLLFTIPGIPLIYNGDEMAASFSPYDEGPPLHWNDAHPLAQHYRQLARLRIANSALTSGELHILKSENDAQLLAFTRSNAAQRILVLLNFGDHPVEARAQDGDGVAMWREFSRSRDLLTGERVRTSARHPRFRVAPMAARVLEVE